MPKCNKCGSVDFVVDTVEEHTYEVDEFTEEGEPIYDVADCLSGCTRELHVRCAKCNAAYFPE